MISEDGETARYGNQRSAIAGYLEENGHSEGYPTLTRDRPALTSDGNYLFIAEKGFYDIPLFRVVGSSTSDWQAPAEHLNISGLNGTHELIRYNGKLFRQFRVGSSYPRTTVSFVSDNGLDWIPGEIFESGLSYSGDYYVVNNTLFRSTSYGFSYFKEGGNREDVSRDAITGIAYGNGTYVVSSGSLFVAGEDLDFQSYSQSRGSKVFFLDDQFVFTSFGATLVSTNGITGVSHDQVFASSSEVIRMSAHDLVDSVIFAEHDLNNQPSANVTGSELAFSEDGIRYIPTFGVNKRRLMIPDFVSHMNIVRSGNTYYGMTNYGTLMSSPAVESSPSEVELLSALPNRIEMTAGVAVNQVLPLPNAAWTCIVSDLPLGVALNVATGEFSGTPQEEGIFSAWVALVTDSRVVQKEVAFFVAAAPAMVQLEANGLSHSSQAVYRQSFAVTSNVEWTATASESWVTLLVAGGSGDGLVRYDLSDNVTTETRQATITVGGGGVFQEFAIVQRGSGASAIWYDLASFIQPAGWRYFDWFKGFKPQGENWIYHGRHGWLYVKAEDTSRMFLWDGALGRWMFTNATVCPWMYAYGADGGWVFFFEGGRPGSRYFKRGGDGQVISEQELSL